ncbi:hypothetical protein AGMMS49957_08960 [Synergistales bacterium]|nr:hypothetical protein AGMMS49957_08960 [Synergistales bacterium]
MQTQAAKTWQDILRGISTLSTASIKKLADYVEELIEEQEEAEDIAIIEARKNESTITFEEVLAKHEAKHGPLN